MASRRRSNRFFARGLSKRHLRAWGRRYFAGLGPSRGWLDRSGIRVISRVASGTQPRFAIAVAGASTPLSVTVAGSDVTLNSATSAGSAATTTNAQAVAALRANTSVTALMWPSVRENADPNAVVAAAAIASLAPTQT